MNKSNDGATNERDTTKSEDGGISSRDVGQLQEECRQGNLDIVKSLVENHPQLDRGLLSMALIQAAKSGHLQIVEYLHKKGAHILDALYLSSIEGDCLIFEYIWENIPAFCDNNHTVLLNNAIEKGHLDIVKYMLDKMPGYIQYHAVLSYATFCGHLEIIRYLCENGADFHAFDENALQIAAKTGHFEIVKYLCQMGANINQVTPFGRSAILEASCSGHLEIVRYLLQLGADTTTFTEYMYNFSEEIQAEINSYNNRISKTKNAKNHD